MPFPRRCSRRIWNWRDLFGGYLSIALDVPVPPFPRCYFRTHLELKDHFGGTCQSPLTFPSRRSHVVAPGESGIEGPFGGYLSIAVDVPMPLFPCHSHIVTLGECGSKGPFRGVLVNCHWRSHAPVPMPFLCHSHIVTLGEFGSKGPFRGYLSIAIAVPIPFPWRSHIVTLGECGSKGPFGGYLSIAIAVPIPLPYRSHDVPMPLLWLSSVLWGGHGRPQLLLVC